MKKCFIYLWLLSFLILGACASKSSPAPASQTRTPSSSPEESTVKINKVSETQALPDSEKTQTLEVQNAEIVPSVEAEKDDTDQDPSMVRCEAKVSAFEKLSIATGPGPTLEEAMDNVVFFACQNLCTDELQEQEKSLDDDRIETLIEECADSCSDTAQVLAIVCHQFESQIYSEGDWNEL